MRAARWPSVSVTSVSPKAISRLMSISMIGISPSGTSGFGKFAVNGWRRTPFPPAKITVRRPFAAPHAPDATLISRNPQPYTLTVAAQDIQLLMRHRARRRLGRPSLATPVLWSDHREGALPRSSLDGGAVH